MDGLEIGANELDFQEIEALFEEEVQQKTPSANEENANANPDNQPEQKKEDVTTTKAFAARLKESTEKARREERDNIAKSLGYESYEAMQKANENKIMTDKGLDPEQVNPVVEEIVKQRLDSDPRIKELEEFKKRQIADFAKKQLEEIKELTDGEITKLDQLPKEVIDVFKKTGDLKQAYMQVEGVKLIQKIKAGNSKGSTDHLQNPSGSSGDSKNARLLTAEEKQIWKLFNPGMTDEELNKMTKVDK